MKEVPVVALKADVIRGSQAFYMYNRIPSTLVKETLSRGRKGSTQPLESDMGFDEMD